MRQFHQFIMLALLDASLLDGGLREVALFQQAERLHSLLGLHPFGQPRLPVTLRSVDGILCRLHFRRLRALQTIHFLQLGCSDPATQLARQLGDVGVAQRGQLHLAAASAQPDAMRVLDRARQRFAAPLGQLQHPGERKRFHPSTSSSPAREASKVARSRMPCIR